MMQDKKGSDPAYQVSGAWCLTPVPIPTFQILTLRSFVKSPVPNAG